MQPFIIYDVIWSGDSTNDVTERRTVYIRWNKSQSKTKLLNRAPSQSIASYLGEYAIFGFQVLKYFSCN